MLDIYIKELGFEEVEVEAIWLRFTCHLSQNDWESITFVKEDVDEDYNYFKLPTGRMVYFPDDLIHKDRLAQID